MSSFHLPNTQALHHKTFKSVYPILAPGDSTLPDVYNWIAQSSPDHPLFVYHNDDTESLQHVAWRDVNKGINRAAHHLTSFCDKRPAQGTVIGVIASSDTITFFTTVMGAVRAGLVPFLISPRNGADAVVHLLRKTGASMLVTSAEPAIQALAEKSLTLLETSGDESLAISKHSMPVFEDLYPSRGDPALESFSGREYDLHAVAMIMHSSGTTSFPKPISWSHRDLLEFSRAPYYGEVDLAGLILGCHGLPAYHSMGLMLIAIAAATGATVSTYKPQFPAVAPTPDNILDTALKTKNDFVCVVPSIVEEWSREPEKVARLKEFKGICFGGGPLSKSVGDYLVDAGASLHQMYGLTETGPMNLLFPSKVDKDWDYYRVNPQANIVLVPREEGKFELVAYADERWSPPVTNTEYEGHKAYASGDLLAPHPTKKGYWKILGRTDEQIMLSTGEKTNPVPLEKILLQDPHIQGAIMFGRGRPYNGVLVEPKKEYRFDPTDVTKLAAFRNKIWPTVERMNDFAPQHSRLFKEMILVTSPDKPFMYTAKGSTRRGAILNQYEAEINSCYEEVERSATVDTPELKDFGAESVRNFIRQVVTSVMDKQVPDDVDIFQSGCDSLQATWIRNKLLLVIKTHDLQASRQLSPNFVYQAPTIVGLSHLVMNAFSSGSDTGVDPKTAHIRELQDTVKRFTSSFPARPANLRPRPTSSGDVVLLTGTTGGLGANLLAHFTTDPTVSKIFAFNRPSGNVVQRQVDAFSKHGVVEDCLRCPKYHFIEGDLTKPFFGLDEITFTQVRDSVTHIIHNAWPVDFNLNLVSFEKHIQGTRNLVDFALSSPFVDPPRLMFISSIGIFRQPTSRSLAPEELVNEASVPLGQGYAESKWVCEHILNESTKKTGLNTVVVRVGQLSGNRVGYWNEREWFPSIVKSALSVGCLPDVPGAGPVSWLPLYDAGKAVAQMRHSSHPTLHLVNPKPIPWRAYLEPISEELGVPLVPWNVWISKLEDDLRDTSLTEVEHLQRNPALHLLEMFKHADLGDDFEPPGLVRLASIKATEVAPSLLEVEVSRDVGKQWVHAWRASGFLPAFAN